MFPSKLQDFLQIFEIEVDISRDFSTKLGSNNSANDSAYSNASKYTLFPSTPIIEGVNTGLRKIFCQRCCNKKKVAIISILIILYLRVLGSNSP